MNEPLWPPEEGSRYTEMLTDIMADTRPPNYVWCNGYRGIIFQTERTYVRPGPLGPDVWWPTEGWMKTWWACDHGHPTKAEARTCAYDWLVATWPGQ